MNSVTIPIPLRGLFPPSRRDDFGLDQVLYKRVFLTPIPLGDGSGAAVLLTLEANGYLLWVMRRARDEEGDPVWTRDTVTILPKDREAAFERAVATAAELRAAVDALTNKALQ